jgi:hypothetical protein
VSTRIDDCIPTTTLKLVKFRVPIPLDRFDICVSRMITAIEECDLVITSERGCNQMPAEKPCTADNQNFHND